MEMTTTVRATLTPREIEVLRLVAGGKVNKEIASDLDISLQTVKSHTVNIMHKLATVTRAHSVAIAKDRGIL